ncbi:MAG: hypothetical protein MGG11_06510 [Trichodesmium sp. MAG_R03]|nr:hypothetical protein [Trichodesmium sp. MAG_R03]
MEQHPAQGMISFSKVQGNRDCFGSDVSLGSHIILTVSTAIKRRHTNNNYYSIDRNIVKVRMTHHQFAELITSLNNGDGIPCTIEWMNNKSVEDYKNNDSTIIEFNSDYQSTLKECMEQLNSIQNNIDQLSKSSRVGKKDITNLQRLISNLSTNLKSNLPFLESRFHEEMVKKYNQVKIEATTWLDNKLYNLGLKQANDNLTCRFLETTAEVLSQKSDSENE